jgi:gamma-glutamylcysteine synthetase
LAGAAARAAPFRLAFPNLLSFRTPSSILIHSHFRAFVKGAGRLASGRGAFLADFAPVSHLFTNFPPFRARQTP